MEQLMKKLIIAAAAALATASTSAFAGGFLGDIIEGACGNCGAGKALDQANKDMGQPVDQFGNAVAGTAVGIATENPYAGAATAAALEARRRAQNNQPTFCGGLPC
jgi:hypothetical protein